MRPQASGRCVLLASLCNALHGHNADRLNANADGKYTYHCLKTLKMNTDNYTMHGFKVYISPNYSTHELLSFSWLSAVRCDTVQFCVSTSAQQTNIQHVIPTLAPILRQLNPHL